MTEIRRAFSKDAGKLTQIAMAAKAYWKYPQSWLDLWREALTITPEFITENEVYVITEDDEIVGFYVLTADSETALLEHLWINPENIKFGDGRKLFAHARETAVSLNAKKMNIESDPNAEEFYQKMGAARIGDARSEIEGAERILPLLQIVL